ncbi:glycosyltransferase, partial [Patescibacteria group bacterium]|nr:glycosyltransferase [Patescibacteria group bacterium]
MKIAILIDHLILGGAQIIALNEAHELIKLGHKVDVLVLVKNPALKREVSSKEKDSSFISRWTSGVFCLFPIKSSPNEKLKENLKEFTRGLNIKYLAENYPIPFRKAILVPPSRFFTTAHLFSPYLAPRVISKQQYDLLIAHGSTTCPTARAIRRRKDIPYIAYINDSVHYIFNKVYKPQITRTKKWISLRKKAQANLPSEFTLSSNKMNISEDLIKRIERSYLNNALVVAALSKHTQNDIRSTYGIKTTVITPGCTPLLQIPTRRGDFLLASSRWSSTKNPEFLLQILQQIPNVQLKIAGGWENQTDLHKFRKEIQKQQLTSRVELITSLNERQKTKLFQRARAWVHPHFEAFGMDALAAASCGCPVIMPYGSGAAQLFEHGQHGFFPPENDLNAFTKYIKELIEDERLAHKLGQKAWKITKDNYTWEKHTEKILENASLKASRYRKAPQCSGDALASRQRDKSPPENASLKASRYRKAPQCSGTALASRQRDKSPPENASLKASRYRKAPQCSGTALASRQRDKS